MELLESNENFETSSNFCEISEMQKQFLDQISELREVVSNYTPEITQSIIEQFDDKIAAFFPKRETAMSLSVMRGYNSAWDQFLLELDPEYIESISDLEQQEQIADYMSSINDIRFEQWSQLTISQMEYILNKMEHDIASIEHRPATQLSVERLEDNLLGVHYDDKIIINSSYLEGSIQNPEMLDQVLNTLIHEGRHRYQHYNVDERMVHQSYAEVESWRENFEVLGYADGEPIEIPILGPFSYTNEGLASIGARLYYYQPVEIDAREFAEETMRKYHNNINA